MIAPEFWYQEPCGTSSMLAPLSQLYRLGNWFRRHFANPEEIIKPVVCVGNIVAGGAGKTPTALSLAVVIMDAGYNPVFVTRGYGGQEKGPIRVDPSKHTAKDVGDEALLLARMAPTFIGRDRVATLKVAQNYGSHIILDDGLQNPNIIPDTSFLVIDGPKGLGNERVIPAGPLRETLADIKKRLNAVVIIGNDEHDFTSRFELPVLHAQIEPVLPSEFPLTKDFIAFAGIGRPDKFYDTCQKAGLSIVQTKDFPDHYLYTKRDLERLKKLADHEKAILLTTEKDWVRLPPELRGQILYLPIVLIFDDKQSLSQILAL
jgi:tetraacyldisaccharide 4'-kinase